MRKPLNSNDENAEQVVEELMDVVKTICASLADDPTSLCLTSGWAEPEHLSIFVSPGNNKPGLLIGKEGRLARSIRILAKSVGQKLRIKHVSVTFEG